MAIISSNILTVICLCFAEVYSYNVVPYVSPIQFADTGKPFAEFVCEADLRKGEWLSWYKGRPSHHIFTTVQQKYEYGYKTIDLLLPLKTISSGDQIYCEKETTKKKQIKSQMIPIVFDRTGLPSNNNKPQIMPETFVDDENSIISFTCWEDLQKLELLSWYQIKESKEVSRLAMIQQENLYGYIKLEMKKTLQPSDNGSAVYCAKETVWENQGILTFSTIAESPHVPLMFHRHIEPLETPKVTTSPSNDIMIVNKDDKLQFSCNGNTPVDGRSLTWYSDSDRPLDQNKYPKLDYSLLTISNIDKGYHRSQFYCAQDFNSYIQVTEGKWLKHSYGELARSHTITLLYQLKEDSEILVTPEKYVDDGKSVIEFSCYAFLRPRQMLSWHQSKGSHRSDDILLSMIQLKGTEYAQWMKLHFTKTLQPSDNGSEIYCATQDVKPNQTFVTKTASRRIPLVFQTNFARLETPYVRVDPSSSVILFNNNDVLQLVCEGSKPVDGRSYIWYLRAGNFISTLYPTRTIRMNKEQYNMKLTMQPSHHRNQLYFAQDYRMYIQVTGSYWTIYSYGELTRSNTITLLHRGTEELYKKPQLIPENFVDQNNTFIVFTCYSFTRPGEVLSWYQSKGLDRSYDIILPMTQVEDPKSKERQWTVLTLNKTLEPSDNGTEIYCTKQRVLMDGSLADGLESERVPITLQRNVPPLERLIVVEPNETVYFDINTTQQFICSGSKPVDGRNYTWFMKVSNSSFSIPKGQYYNASTIRNVLELSLDETYNRSQLFCAQEFLAHSRHQNDSSWWKFYGELAGRSNTVTLMLRGKDVYDAGNSYTLSSPSDINWTILAIALSLCLVALAAAAVVLRRRRTAQPATPAAPATPTPPTTTTTASLACPTAAAPAPPTMQSSSDKDGDDVYVTLSRETAPTQVTYAVLDLPRAGAAHATPAEPSLYAEVVSVYKP